MNPVESPVVKGAKLIRCILPDDGTEKKLLQALYRERGITRANNISCRTIALFAEAQTRRGKLPEPQLARMVFVVADPAEADALFDFIHDRADIGRPGGGMLTMEALTIASRFLLPPDVADEALG